MELQQGIKVEHKNKSLKILFSTTIGPGLQYQYSYTLGQIQDSSFLIFQINAPVVGMSHDKNSKFHMRMYGGKLENLFFLNGQWIQGVARTGINFHVIHECKKIGIVSVLYGFSLYSLRQDTVWLRQSQNICSIIFIGIIMIMGKSFFFSLKNNRVRFIQVSVVAHMPLQTCI